MGMTAEQRQQLWQVLMARGQANDGDLPQLKNHWRLNLDQTRAIFEALFAEDQLTISQFKAWLGNIFGVDPATIDHATVQHVFFQRPTQIVTFSRLGLDYLGFAVFGGTSASWQESRKETIAYLLANISDWEEG